MVERPAVTAEELSDLIAESMAQQQVLLMALRRIATLSRAAGQEPAMIAEAWRILGHAALDRAPLTTAAGQEGAVRAEAKLRLDDIIEQGLR